MYGEEHPEVARSLNNLGVAYEDQGNLPLAIEYYAQALTIYKKSMEKSIPKLPISLYALGRLHQNIGEFSKAEVDYLQAVTILRKKDPEGKNWVLRYSLSRLGLVKYDQGRFEEAMNTYQESLRLKKKVDGEEARAMPPTSIE